MTSTPLTLAQEQWLDRVTRWQRSGLDRDTFAAQEGVATKRLAWWRWNLGRLGLSATAAPVTSSTALSFVKLNAPSVDAPPGLLEVVSTNGRVVRVPVGFDELTLTRVLAALERGAQ